MGPRRHTTARPSGVRASGMSTEGSVRLRRERTAGLLPPTMPIPRAVWCGARSRNRCPHTRGAAHPARQPGRTGHRSARPVYREPGGPPAQVASSRRFRPRLRPCRTRWWTPARWPPRRLWRRRRHPSPFGATARSSSTLENRTATAARRHCRHAYAPATPSTGSTATSHHGCKNLITAGSARPCPHARPCPQVRVPRAVGRLDLRYPSRGRAAGMG